MKRPASRTAVAALIIAAIGLGACSPSNTAAKAQLNPIIPTQSDVDSAVKYAAQHANDPRPAALNGRKNLSQWTGGVIIRLRFGSGRWGAAVARPNGFIQVIEAGNSSTVHDADGLNGEFNTGDHIIYFIPKQDSLSTEYVLPWHAQALIFTGARAAPASLSRAQINQAIAYAAGHRATPGPRGINTDSWVRGVVLSTDFSRGYWRAKVVWFNSDPTKPTTISSAGNAYDAFGLSVKADAGDFVTYRGDRGGNLTVNDLAVITYHAIQF